VAFDRVDDPLTLVLAVCALLGTLAAADVRGTIEISASFVCCMLAVAFLGPAPALVVAVVGEGGAWLVQHYRRAALGINVAGLALPLLAASAVFELLASGAEEGGERFLAALFVASVLMLALNFLSVSLLTALVDRLPLRASLAPPAGLLLPLTLTLGFTLLVAEVLAVVGLTAAVLLVGTMIGFTYMASLVAVARERTRQYASLSWGVLSGLLRTLDRRDGRTARHSAAVAAFARDIARQAGLPERDQELAHTAGLLHDIGKFAFADRVLERGEALHEEDWREIRQHPEQGADLLRDLGVYGPVAELVRAHHERVDGRGYPDRLRGDDIPPIARILAVAEVYDTLTAQDTYRSPMTSFAALNELRRVAGTQLDSRFVEALAELLAGRGLEDRHADDADFDRELAMERRLADSVA
jgi:putative nucleotidyltransferase with HDIG domain